MIDEAIFKAYDIRGIYPDQLNEDIAYKVGRALVTYLNCDQIAVGQDVRLSSPSLFESLARGINDSGADVYHLGVISTDGMYFAVGKYGFPAGIMITASHNPGQYNGFKMCREKAIPLSGDEGIDEIREIINKGQFREGTGKIVEKIITEDYVEHILGFINVNNLKPPAVEHPLRVVVDCGNGVGGIFIKKLFEYLPCKLIPMYLEPDGNFPNHLPNPIEPENTQEIRQKVVDINADLGAAFDGDADRVFLVDNKGRVLNGGIVGALIARSLLHKEPQSKFVYNIICSRVMREMVEKYGGTAIKSRVGHAFIKPLMRKYDAIFGAEHSGHFYFRDNFYADSGLIAFVIILELVSQENEDLAQLVDKIDNRFRIDETNFQVDDISEKMKELERKLKTKGYTIDKLDGLTVEMDDFWFNLRPSNTEPLIRMNIEAKSQELLEEKKKELARLFR
mgnify:CR=1 FL=1